MSASWTTKDYCFTPDLNAYFVRIQYHGSREPTSDVLKQIQWHHAQAIPYENLDVHLLGKVDISPQSVERKIVGDGRGGYCYEHNHFMLWVLRTIGFDVTPVLARARWQKPENVITPTIHLVLKVKIDNVLWLFDAGFSSFMSPIPLLIDTDEPQTTPLETRRIIKTDVHYAHQMQFKNDEKWRDVYTFTLEETFTNDWVVGNFYVYSHPESIFKQNIILSRPTKTNRLLLFNKTLKISELDGTLTSREIQTQEEYLSVLREYFGIHLPEGTVLYPPNMPW